VDALTSFQWIAFAILGLSFAVTLALTVRRVIAPRIGFAWGVLWIAAAVAIAKPELTGVVARALGIGRGTDLVLYFAILFMIFGFFAVYVRLRRIESDMTKLVRELAVRSASEPDAGAAVDVDDRLGVSGGGKAAP
jgi:small membrane protein